MMRQMNVIADVLDSDKVEWDCVFHMTKRIGEHDYDIVIERKKNRLELTATLPLCIDPDRRPQWRGRLREANEAVDCGRYCKRPCVDGSRR